MTRRILSLARQAILVGAMGVVTPAFADQSCGDDLQKLAQKREAALQSINAMVSAAKGKQLDPTVFCTRSAPLNQAETAMLAYMEKNKDWCQVPTLRSSNSRPRTPRASPSPPRPAASQRR